MNRQLRTFIFGLVLGLLLGSCAKLQVKESNTASAVKFFKGGGNDKVNSVEKTADGGFIYCGFTGTDSSNTNAFLLKVDGSGNQQWYRTYGGANYDEFRHAIPTSDGGFIAVGRTNSIGKGALSKDHKLFDYAVKVNSIGIEEWSNSYANLTATSITKNWINRIIESADHSFYMTGNNQVNTDNVSLIKINASGTLVFSSFFESLSAAAPFFISNNYQEYVSEITFAEDSAIIISGIMNKSSLIVDLYKFVTFLAKINPANGKIIWWYPYYNNPSANITYFNSFRRERVPNMKTIKLADGYLIGNSIELEEGAMRFQLIKTNFSGVQKWEKEFKGLGTAIFQSLNIASDGTILLVGITSESKMNGAFAERLAKPKMMLLKLDQNGNELWSNFVVGSENTVLPKCILAQPNGGWTIGGSWVNSESTYDKMFRMEVDKNGNILNSFDN